MKIKPEENLHIEQQPVAIEKTIPQPPLLEKKKKPIRIPIIKRKEEKSIFPPLLFKSTLPFQKNFEKPLLRAYLKKNTKKYKKIKKKRLKNTLKKITTTKRLNKRKKITSKFLNFLPISMRYIRRLKKKKYKKD